MDCPCVSWAHPLDLFREAGDEARPADIDIGIGPGAAVERDIVDFAEVIDGEDVAFGGARGGAGGQFLSGNLHQLAVARGDFGDGCLNLLGRHLGDVAGQRDGREIRQRDFRQHLHLQGEFQILGRTGRRWLQGHHFQLRRHRRAKRAVGD